MDTIKNVNREKKIKEKKEYMLYVKQSNLNKKHKQVAIITKACLA